MVHIWNDRFTNFLDSVNDDEDEEEYDGDVGGEHGGAAQRSSLGMHRI